MNQFCVRWKRPRRQLEAVSETLLDNLTINSTKLSYISVIKNTPKPVKTSKELSTSSKKKWVTTVHHWILHSIKISRNLALEIDLLITSRLFITMLSQKLWMGIWWPLVSLWRIFYRCSRKVSLKINLRASLVLFRKKLKILATRRTKIVMKKHNSSLSLIKIDFVPSSPK